MNTTSVFIIFAYLLFCALAKKPNFLFLQTDSMDGRIVDPTSDVYAAQHTPHLRSLSSSGVNFINTYSPSPQCVPSRSAMWTGLRTDLTKTWNNDQGLCGKWNGYTCVNQNVSGIYELFDVPLRQAGYVTSLLGRLDMGAGYGGGFHNDGPETWTRSANINKTTRTGPSMAANNKDPYAHDYDFLDHCLNYIENEITGGTTPFFLHCGFLIPHPGYTTNSTYMHLINDTAVTMPKWQPYEDMHPYDQHITLSKCVLPNDCTGENATDAEILQARKLYYATCAQSDEILGKVIEALKASGRFDDTIIIYLSDHGELAMDHRQWLKNAMYEGSTRVPLIISGPGFLQNSIVSNVTSLLDIYPTLMELAGAEGPANLSGESLVPFLFSNQSGTHKDYVISQYHSNFANTGSFMVRQGDWKYIAFGTNPPYQDYKPQLFNVKNDPDEIDDVAAEHPQIVKQMDDLLMAEFDYVSVDKEVKLQDYQMYKSWQADHPSNFWQLGWKDVYHGFDEEDQAQAENWIANGPFSLS